MESSDATVWVSSLDTQPIASGRHLLVTHLTDLQNTGIRYAEAARQTLLEWGQLPHLVRAGKAHLQIRLAKPEALRVWALSTGGRRLPQVPCMAKDGMLQFETDVSGDMENGARFIYEIGER